MRIWKDGFRKTQSGTVQRYLCRNCEYRFSEFASRDSGHNGNIPHQDTSGCRVCVSEREAKNLAAEPPINVESAGATEQTKNASNETIFQFKWWMKKQGYAESTITSRAKILQLLTKRGGNLEHPDSIKAVIARQTSWSEGRKENAVHSYSTYLRKNNRTWDPPRYKRVHKLPWIPTESEIEQLIAGCSPKVATFLQLLKETGMRPGEAWNLRRKDLDFHTKRVYITPEKGSNPRLLPISNKLIAMLHITSQNTDHVFNTGLLKHFANGFRQQRKRMTAKLNNPRILRISFKTLRHFKATMEYHKTKDILHVKQLLGHKNIKNTLVYTQLVNFHDDEYVSKVATTSKQACHLLEAGFEYICTTPDALMLFRKRK